MPQVNQVCAKLLINPDSIIIPDGRQRSEFEQEEMDALAHSISVNGQIQPIVVTMNMQLVAGERRLRACKQLGIDVWYTILDVQSKLDAEEIELEENIRRVDIPWYDRARAVRKIHNLRAVKYGDKWTQGDTASALNINKGTMSIYMALADAIISPMYPEIREKKTLRDAWSYIQKQQEQATLEKLKNFYPERQTSVTNELPEMEASETQDNIPFTDYLFPMDCLDVLATFPAESIDLIYSDPMWGIGYDELTDGVDICDDADVCRNTMELFIEQAARVLKNDRWFVMWFGIEHYVWLTEVCRKNNLSYNVTPILWTKNNGKANMMEYCFGHAYEMALMIKKGQPTLAKRRVLDYFNVPQVARPRRKMEKPLELAKQIIECTSNPGDIVFDGFMGTGTSVAAAWQLGRTAFGCEIDPAGFNYAVETWEREVNRKTEEII